MTQPKKDAPHTNPKRNYYNMEQILNIPIEDVCTHFGIHVKYKGRNPWCSIRREDKTPSVILHVASSDRHQANTYCDFGAGNEYGNNIDLTCHMLGLDRTNKTDRSTAIEHLAQTFRIPPVIGDKPNPNDLSDREWALLGLHGDRATKNFRFDPDRMSIEQINSISQKYNMSMNELKKSHPHIFERLLKTHAIPHLQEARNHYYMQLWMGRNNLRSIFGIDATLTDQKDFEATAAELRSMERALSRAIRDTSLAPLTTQDYYPDEVLKRIDSGELKPNFGTKTYRQMTRLAQSNETVVKYRALDLSRVLYEGTDLFQDIPFSAFLKNGNAIVGYLGKDEEALRPILDQLAVSENRPLSVKLKEAKERQITSAANPSQCTKTQLR